MTIESDRWIRFEIDVDFVDGRCTVRHRVSCVSSFDSAQPEQCHLIEITSQVGRTSKTVSVQDATTCAQEIPLGRKTYQGSTLLAVIQQSPDVEQENYIAHHLPGTSLRGSCRLNPLLSDLEAWRYLASNIDVAEALGPDPEGARHHYRDYGRYESRSFAFEPLFYLASHPDLETLGENESMACKHFIDHGHSEGRQISFHPKSYLDCNPDVQAALGADERAASLHYLRHGRREGRLVR